MNIHSQLNPRVKPFPDYLPDPICPPSQAHSSPPLTQTTTSSSGSGTSARTSTNPSTPFPYSVLHPTAADTKVHPVKEFGYGWSSSTVPVGNRIPTSTSISITDPTPDPIIIPSRTRSPSAPVHSTQAPFGLGHGHGGNAHSVNHHPSLDHILHHKQSTGRVPFPTTNHAPNSAGLITPRRYPSHASHTTQLNHYSSVPSLTHDIDHDREYMIVPSLSTKYSSTNVNQWRHGVLGDSVEEEGDEHVFQPSLTNIAPLSSSRSVPGLTQAMSSPTLAHEFTQSRNIYIPSVSANVSEAQLHREASQYGEILSLKLDRTTLAGSRAFVMFQDVDAAFQYYCALKKSGTPCEIAKEDYSTVHKSLEDPTSANLYIQGFLPDDDIEFCRSVLAPGRVISHSRPTDAQGRPRGILMARLESRAQADEAISRLNDQWIHPVTQQKLQVRIADSEQQKQYKKKNDLNRDDKFPSMPNMRYNHAPKILNLKYSDERDWSSPPSPALHRQISRETSFASIRSPVSIAFPGHQNVGSNVPPPSPGYYHRHKSSTFSTGPGATDWVSRQGWTPGAGPSTGAGSGTGSIQIRGRAGLHQSQNQGQGRGGHEYGYGGHHDAGLELDYEDVHHPFGSQFPDIDPSTVTV